MPKHYTRRKVIAVDVDGTLIDDRGRLNRGLVSRLQERKDDGYFLFLWSAQGEEHARAVATKHNVADMFDLILSKPGYYVDDMGWSWTKWTKRIRI